MSSDQFTKEMMSTIWYLLLTKLRFDQLYERYGVKVEFPVVCDWFHG